jgi:hypothetical protein
LRLFALFLILGASLACSRPGTTAATPPPVDPATRLQAIPPANSEKSRNMNDMKDWKNPYLIVREDGIGLLDLANHEIHILKPEVVPAALANLPPSAWPYGRVVVVQESGVVSGEEGKVRIRENRALLIGTLETLKVAVNEVPPA